jgi:hypothetical protein
MAGVHISNLATSVDTSEHPMSLLRKAYDI